MGGRGGGGGSSRPGFSVMGLASSRIEQTGESRQALECLINLLPLFLPQSTNPDLSSRLGTVPPSLSQKGAQVSLPPVWAGLGGGRR